MDSTGQLRDTYDLLSDLSKVYGNLSQNQKQYLSEEIAGKRQVSVLQSLLSNWESVDVAVKNATNSTGSAEKENERYLGSIQANLEKVKSSFQELSFNTIEAGAVKTFLSIVNGLIKITQNVGILNVAFGALLLTLYKFNKTPSIFFGIQDAMYSLMQKMGALKVMSESTALSIASLSPALMLMAGTAVLNALEDWSVSLEEQKQIVVDLKDELVTLQSEYDSLSKKTDKTDADEQKLAILEKQLEIQKALVVEAQKEQYAKEYEGDIDWFAKAKENLSYGVVGDADASMNKQLKDTTVLQGELTKFQREATESEIEHQQALGNGTEVIKQRVEYIQQLTDKQVSLQEEIKNLDATDADNNETLKDKNSELNEVSTSLLKQSDALLTSKSGLIAYNEANVGARSENDSLISSIDSVVGATDALVQSTQTSAEATADSQDISSSLTSVYDNLKSSMELVTQAQAEQDEQGYLSLDTVLKMIEAGTQYSDLLTFQNGQFQLQGDATNTLWEIKKAEAINTLQLKKDEIQMQIAVQEAVISAYENEAIAAQLSSQTGQQSSIDMAEVANTIIASLGGVSDAVISSVNKAVQEANKLAQLDGGSDKLRNQIVNLKKESANLDNLMTNISNMTLPQFTASVNSASKATDKAKDSTKGLEKEIDNLKDTIDGLKDTLSDAKDKLEETTKAYEFMQEAIENQLDKEIEALEKKLDLIDEQKERYEMMQNLAKKQLEDEMQALQDQIDALDEKKKEEDDILKLEEAQLAVRKEQEALDNAKSNKDTRVYTEDKGWVKDCPKFTISVKG